MNRVLVLCLVATLVLCACPKPPPPPPAPTTKAKPEPTPEEIAAQIRPALEPYRNLLRRKIGSAGTGAADGLSPADRKRVREELQAAKQKFQHTENGKQAIRMVTHDAEEMIRNARDQSRWRVVKECIETWRVLSPGSTKMDRVEERADLHLRQPRVTVKGFFDDDQTGNTYVFLEVTERPSNKRHDLRARVGEQFFHVELLDIVGDNKGVRLEYLLIPGTIWEVMGP